MRIEGIGTMDYGKWIERGLAKADRGEKTKTIEALAKRLRLSPSHFYQYKQGKIIPTKKQIAIMAEFFGEDPPQIKKPQASGAVNHISGNVVALHPTARTIDREWISYPVLGAVEAGAFREEDMLAQVEPRSVPGERSQSHPNVTPMAWEAHGDSMNEVGIFDGTIIMGVDFQEAGGVLSNNNIVVVEQNRGGLIERSVKAVAIFTDRTEFQPRSTNPIHRPIIYKNGNSDDDVAVRILTVVHGTYNSLRN